ncbi:MAG TPA: ATP-binding protein [Myxococcota bacterium]|jgi:two-component system nitrogen regulation sensor histidine kinase NtrY
MPQPRSPSERPPTEPAPQRAREPGDERSPNLPEAERRRRRRELWISLGVGAALAALFLLEPIAGLTRSVADSGLFLFLNAVVVILILLLGFLVTRSFWKLVAERRRGTLGSHLNLKFVSAFVLIAFVTASLLFAISAVIVTQSIDRWFGVQVDSALEKSGRIAERYYEATAQRALLHGGRIAEQITARGLLREGNRTALGALIHTEQRAADLGVVEVFDEDREQILSAANPGVPSAGFGRGTRELVRSALAGRAGWRVEDVGSGDLIRSAVPIASRKRPGKTAGALVFDTFVPEPLARDVGIIRETLGQYRALQPNAGNIRTAYLLELLLGFLVILMLATWVGFRITKGVTGPIRELAKASAEVARGNLEVAVEPPTDDEVGFLVRSFNRMTRDLRDARARLERSNAELDQRRRSMEVVLGTIGAGVLSLDAEGRITTVNPTACRQLGIAAEASPIGDLLADCAGQPQLRDLIVDLVAKLRPAARESIRRQAQVPLGEDLATLLVTVRLLHDEAGGVLGSVVVLDDYTQPVKVQRMVAWREVASRIAHEIKNPLTPIQLSAQRIRRRFRSRIEADPEDVKVFDECVDAITSQVDGLKLLVDEFSNFARLPTANPQAGDLNRIIADAVSSYDGTEHVAFDADLDPSLPTVEIDREQIRRALTNLIDNAIAAVQRSRPGERAGRVVVRSAWDPSLQSVRFEVADDGVGIPPEDRRRIFEPYFSTKPKGTGLGLAIVSRIVADHHGYIRVQDNPPKGTRFIVELPARGA